MDARLDETALVDPSASVGSASTVWGLAQLREDVVVGDECVVGRGAYLGPGVRVGHRCKIQNGALLYEPATLADGVFVGPGVILTNDAHPRAVNVDGSLKSAADWQPVGVTIGEGASLGAGALCVAPVSVGQWAMVAAGAVVTRDVPDHALVAGVPARRVGWVGRAGVPLVGEADGSLRCTVTNVTYREVGGALEEQDAGTDTLP
ncbi:acyltransferase [Nocardioides sp.]|uniref:acyltransferase n=1 Tax=Nocardioides sp. TaxID=35761 RepID=UPI002D80C636|nr:acyltransferase [Nocardioides sp.]HET8960445.1 acyltransferase [Nocardioides sp.]